MMNSRTGTDEKTRPRWLGPAVEQRTFGALVGSAVGDALGAPFEFKPAGQYAARFPEPVLGGIGEMVGGGGFAWAPGEFTDDTQMALVLAESLVACGGVDPDDLWARFRAWRAGATDVGINTSAALSSPTHVGAAEAAHARYGRSASNGALMRSTPIVLAYLDASVEELMAAAVAQGELTHFDPAASWGAAIYAELVRRAIHGLDPLAETDDVLTHVPADVRGRFAEMLAPSWTPDESNDTPGNGSVWGCLAQAVWAVRSTSCFADAVRAAINLGDDADTVACVTGGLAGARYSIQGIPSRWTTYLHGAVNTPDGVATYDNAGLQDLARRLLGLGTAPDTAVELPAGPVEVAPGLWAADLLGAATAPTDWAVISLARTGGRFARHPARREVFLLDHEGDANTDLAAVVFDVGDTIDAFLAEGRQVVVHCHGGRSRTGLVLRAWAMRHHAWTEREAHHWLAERWHRHEDYNDSFTTFLGQDWPTVVGEVSGQRDRGGQPPL